MPLTNNQVLNKFAGKIIAELESGNLPRWRKPWTSQGSNRNAFSGREYSGINLIATAFSGYKSPLWMTFDQAKKAGGYVKKDEKGTIIIFVQWVTKKDTVEDPDNPWKNKFPIFKYHTLFNSEQVDGVELPKEDQVVNDFQPIESAENIVANIQNPSTIKHERDYAFYAPSSDVVNMPEKNAFESPESYYSTLFHELSHSTGHKSRLNRKGFDGGTIFGSQTYGKEVLIAELSAALLCGQSGIQQAKLNTNSAAYIAGWLKTIKEDPSILVWAGSAAAKASNMILNNEAEKKSEKAA